MSTEDDLTVWSSMLDGKYAIKVIRTAPYRGELTVAAGTEILHRQPVGLTFDALFGPDWGDVQSWQAAATEFVDNLPKP